ncbi:TRAP transporter large permease subunit [Chloroflexota bacterium]
MSIELITVLLFVTLMLFLVSGLPVAFGLGALAFIFGMTIIGPKAMYVSIGAAFNLSTNFVLICAPMFIYMAYILGGSRVGEDLYAAMRSLVGRIKGGLAAGTIGISTIMAAMVGISGPTLFIMGHLAYPEMVTKYGYDKKLAGGSIAAGAGLGILIPPSITMVLYGAIGRESVAQLFAAGIIPGLILAGLYAAYILIRCNAQPHLGPAIPERSTWRERTVSLKGLILPFILIFAVLGSIFSGAATPTEASAIGVIGAFICAAINRRLSWKMFKEASINTVRLTGVAFWLIFGGASVGAIYIGTGASHFVEGLLAAGQLAPMAVIGIMMIIIMFLGCFMDPTSILMITIPIFVPIVRLLGFDTVWFGILYILNIEMALVTPPFGFSLFFMKAVYDPPMKITEIYLSIIPFVLCEVVALLLIMFVPQLALILPTLMLR